MVSPHESPAHFSVSGNFSEDDIQHLLGAMIESHAPTQQHQEQQEKQEVIETTSVASSLSVAVAAEIDEESRALARSERKRSREKQRRLDVNKQFTDLTKLISQLEKEEREEDPTVFRQSFSATNRADLICRTIAHLERLRDTNKRRRTECSSLQEQLQAAKKAGEDMAEKCKGLVSSSQNMMMPQPNKQVCLRAFCMRYPVYRSLSDLFSLHYLGHDDGAHDDASRRNTCRASIWNASANERSDESIHDATAIHGACYCHPAACSCSC